MSFVADRVHELRTVDDLKLLTVGIERLETWWRPGLLCIGDAAHTMSPIGGVGVNIAVQDAVAASNILAAPLKEGWLRDSDLEAVQARRLWPVRATQAAQVFLQNRMIAPTLAGTRPLRPPWPVRLLAAVPFLRRIPARLLGLGVQPEHVKTKPA
jgi:2-polyprenyl-6-methoxyphenol hydroxylase-like FAD-dependent oxidoreductase